MVALSPLSEDQTHPIPVVSTCDIYAPKKEGGAKLVIVIASPLGGDARSLDRLTKKIEHYLGFIASDQFSAECGAPTPLSTILEVVIHPQSDAAAFSLLERCRDWVSDNRAQLVVRKEANQSAQTTPGSCAPLRV